MAADDLGRASALSGDAADAGVSVPADALLDALAATRADGDRRRLVLGGSAGDRAVRVDVWRDADGRLSLGIADFATVAAGEPLRGLARQMAAETDMRRLLEMLCAAAAEATGASGAAILNAVTNQVEISVATGRLGVAHGRRFPLRGSLTRDVLKTRDLVAVPNLRDRERSLLDAVPEVAIGPVILAPLIAHDVILGVVTVVRLDDDAPFGRTETDRLRVIAEYAALALWKAELLEQAQAADRAKSRFLATVSHELRTPLTALAGYEELLVDQVIGPLSESQADVLERMRAVTQHLAAVIEELLAFSSLDEGREVVRPSEFLAADLVRAAAAVIEPLATHKQLDFRITVPDRPLRMTSDIDKVRQILVNLAGNAVKFTDAGEIGLALDAADDEVRFTVRDTGIGIAPRDLDRLFHPFAQLDAGLTRRHGGTGLGLYISRGLATLLGGRIEVQSEPGCGSEFTLVLPKGA